MMQKHNDKFHKYYNNEFSTQMEGKQIYLL